MNKQSHFEPKATLRASSTFSSRPPFAELEGVLPVVGSTVSYVFTFLQHYVFTFPKHLDRFLRGEARQGAVLRKSNVKAPFVKAPF
jgi:hypothetical protein